MLEMPMRGQEFKELAQASQDGSSIALGCNEAPHLIVYQGIAAGAVYNHVSQVPPGILVEMHCISRQAFHLSRYSIRWVVQSAYDERPTVSKTHEIGLCLWKDVNLKIYVDSSRILRQIGQSLGLLSRHTSRNH